MPSGLERQADFARFRVASLADTDIHLVSYPHRLPHVHYATPHSNGNPAIVASLSLAGKVAVVTRSSRNIGAVIAPR